MSFFSMLSEPSDFNPQVFPDYTITAWNHRQALVAVTPIGTSVTGEDGRGSVGEGDVTLFRQVLDVVKKVDHVTPVSIAGQQQVKQSKLWRILPKNWLFVIELESVDELLNYFEVCQALSNSD